MQSYVVYDEIKTIDDLLNLHDEQFVATLYRRLLGRAPDARGQAGYLRALRHGRAQLDIIREIARSDEAQSKVIELAGLDAALKKFDDRTQSLLGRWRFRHNIDYGRSKRARLNRALANQMSGLENRLVGRLGALANDVETLSEQVRAAPTAPPADNGSTGARKSRALHTIRSRGLAWRSVDLPGSANRMIARLKL